MRIWYSLAGAFIAVIVDLLVSLLAAAIQQQAFGDRFSQQSIFWLAGLIVVGLLLGYWLGEKIPVPAASPASSPAPPAPSASRSAKTITITRLRALLSYGELKGRGIHLSDILLIGSVLKVDADSSDKD